MTILVNKTISQEPQNHSPSEKWHRQIQSPRSHCCSGTNPRPLSSRREPDFNHKTQLGICYLVAQVVDKLFRVLTPGIRLGIFYCLCNPQFLGLLGARICWPRNKAEMNQPQGPGVLTEKNWSPTDINTLNQNLVHNPLISFTVNGADPDRTTMGKVQQTTYPAPMDQLSSLEQPSPLA
ncbi:hypothetical protein VNO77_02925 [Canavalia gladiata]|uniref:Uncharacterized protein n=1 Tax=Canavalia gladiata TaxID=3824 RepID=A0AAN9MZ24_CANGL